MTQSDILNEFEQLPLQQQVAFIEAALRVIKRRMRDYEQSTDKQKILREAAASLKECYDNDEELTAFTTLDGEDFNESG